MLSAHMCLQLYGILLSWLRCPCRSNFVLGCQIITAGMSLSNDVTLCWWDDVDHIWYK